MCLRLTRGQFFPSTLISKNDPRIAHEPVILENQENNQMPDVCECAGGWTEGCVTVREVSANMTLVTMGEKIQIT